MKPLKHSFKCYLCDKDKSLRQRDLVIGTGKLVQYICKKCTSDNYTITNNI